MILWLTVAAYAANCDLSGPPDAAFTEKPGGSAASLVIEVRAGAAGVEWVRSMADTVASRGLHAVIVAPPTPEELAPLAPLVAAGHELALDLTDQNLGVDPLVEARAIKIASKSAGKLTGVRPRTVAAMLPKRTVEALVGYGGARVILEEEGKAGAVPRIAASYQGQVQGTVVLPGGPYRGACGTDPRIGRFTPAAADRAAVALRVATDEPAVVRVVLTGAEASADDAAVLGRWLDEVVLPAGVRVATPSELHGRVMAALERVPVAPTPTGRYVQVDDLRLAAEALRDVQTLPRELPGDLVPTEALLGFARLLAGQAEGDVVKLGELAGPRADAKTTLPGTVEIPRADVEAAAKALLVALPEHVPSSLPVGGRLLTAGELLLLFASAARGDEPPTTRPVASLDPNEDGLGWGVSSD